MLSTLDDAHVSLLMAALGLRSRERARAILDRAGGLNALCLLDRDSLVAVGASSAAASRLAAVRELLRQARDRPDGRRAVQSSGDAYHLVAPLLLGELVEHLVVLCLDRAHHWLRTEVVSIGSPSFTIVDPRVIYRVAVRWGAAAVVLAHNHPSGDPTPSLQDIEVTRRVARAGEVLGIPLLDHLVVADAAWVSLRERGNLPGLAESPALIAA